MVEATRKHGRVFQTGSMQRSAAEFRQAVQLVRTGAIGKIKKVYVNVGGPPKAWDLDPEAIPSGLNWDLWLGPNKARPYNNLISPAIDAKFWSKWREYDEFGGGDMTDWGAHMFDIAQWGLGMDNSGPVEVIYSETDKGLLYKYANGIEMIHEPKDNNRAVRFVGTDGEVLVARGMLKTSPENLKDKVLDKDVAGVYYSDNHYKDFLDAIRSRKAPICDVEVGHRTATVCNIGNIAYRLKRSLQWDPGQEIFVNDPEASTWLGREMKKEWKV